MPYTSPSLADNTTLQRLLNRGNHGTANESEISLLSSRLAQDPLRSQDTTAIPVANPVADSIESILHTDPESQDPLLTPLNTQESLDPEPRATSEPLHLEPAFKLLSGTQSHDSDPLGKQPLLTETLDDEQETPQNQPGQSSQILNFAMESTQLYSYAQLSQNSLALRLNVLKRSLEILSEHPELYSSYEPPSYPSLRQDNEDDPKRRISIQTNASSALLSLLFRQQTSQPQPQQPQRAAPQMARIPSRYDTSTPSKQQMDLIDTVSNDVKDIIKLLDDIRLVDLKSNQPQKLVNDLHDLSLLNLNNSKQEDLKIRLLHALATPFVENSNTNPNTTMMQRSETSNISLSTLQYQSTNANGRLFHSMSSNKKVAPQAIFTCDLEAPWSMKLANDLACLMFGVSRSSLRAFTLMDLIASRSRDFVLSKLMKAHDKLTIFAGEIIAIQRPNNHFAWTSMWGKRKDNMMILIFDQIPCDSGDLVITKDNDRFVVKSFVSNYGNQLFSKDLIGKDVSLISKTLLNDINGLTLSVEVSSLIKKTRYYTLLINKKNAPSAITAVTLDSDTNIPTVKLNIHSMPYIAGTLVISSKDYNILSYNSAACKNLFGHGKDLLNSSIDFLIPNFTKLLSYLFAEDKNLHLKVGLVLPEHYFRKAASLVATLDQDELEFLFLNSDGISARHRDGNSFKIDVQLRVTSLKTLMLWITYSGGAPKVSNDTEKQVHFDNPIGNRSVINQIGDDKKVSEELNHQQIDEEIDLPSQLRLFNESEIDSCGSSMDGLSRENSVKTPLRKVHHSSSSLELKQRRKPEARTPSTSSNSSITLLSKTPPSSSATNLDQIKAPLDNVELIQRGIKAIALNGSVVKQFSELELLKIENESINEIKSKSKLWPKEVGLKRREKKLSDFLILKNMGEGAYGKVVQARHKDDPFYKLIIKCIVKERILVDTWVRDRKLGTIPSEIQIMDTLNHNPHPNIMRIVDFFEDSKYYYLETPQHGDPPGIDLFDLIELQTSMNELECKFIFRQIVQAVHHLHQNGIIHRDIKDENIIIDNQGIIKLIDFGSASYVKNGPFDVFVGTIDYASPEVLNGKPYEGKPQDVWAMGVLLYTLIYKENPFYNVDEIMEGELRFPFVTSDECIALIEKILDRDIRKRPTMKEILEDPWLSF